jgi:AcrR family transcriptional regulator
VDLGGDDDVAADGDAAAEGDRSIDLRGPRDTRARLVRAAAEVFREKGYTGSRVQEIARRAGFTSGALYTHFDSRAELLAEAIAVENGRMFATLSDGLGSTAEIDARAIAASLARFIELEASPTDKLMLDGFAICTRDEDARSRIGASVGQLLDGLSQSIGFMDARDGSAIDADPDGVAYLLVAFMSGVAALRAAGLGDRVPDGIEALLAGFLDQLGAGDGSGAAVDSAADGGV